MCSITVAVPVVTPQKETPPSANMFPTDNKFDLTEKIFSGPAILLETILFFVTAWLQRVLGIKTLRHVGITTKDIKAKCKIAHQKLSEGHRETKLHFIPERKRKRLAAVVVLVTARNMIHLQSYDLKSLHAGILNTPNCLKLFGTKYPFFCSINAF